MSKKIICFGEPLLRMSPAVDGRWITDHQMPVYAGGSELNVATALALWEQPVSFCSAMPGNYLANDLLQLIQNKNIGTEYIRIWGDRLGLYFLQQGRDLQHSEVIYDRAGSSFCQLQKGMIDWDEVLENAGWFHFSAITPSLNASLAAVCLEAVQAAHSKKIPVSVDLNYRSRLWQYGKQPIDVMPGLVNYCDVIMGNIWAARQFLGTGADPGKIDQHNREAFLEKAFITDRDIREQFSSVRWIAHTFRFDTPAGGIHYYSCLSDHRENRYFSGEYRSDSIVDRIGSGDCFMAGLIYGLYGEKPAADIIDFATAAAFGKMQVKGDATTQDIETIKSLIR